KKKKKKKKIKKMSLIQEKFINSNYFYHYVNGAAGTGKKTLFMKKIDYLLNVKKISFSHLLILSFSNKTLINIRHNFIKNNFFNNFYINENYESKETMSTFHSFTFRFINYFDSLFVFKKSISSLLQEEIIKNLTTQNMLCLNERIEDLIKKITSYKRFQIEKQILKRAPELLKQFKLDFSITDDFKKLFSLYQEYLNQNKMLDYDDLLIKTYEILKNPSHDYYMSFYANYRHIFIDEFQDINLLQYEIVNLLIKNNNYPKEEYKKTFFNLFW
ncbi:UvrD-helicase domain-containing protein, partial ['Camptotheca acuminata' phytoplasma]|uniref:UvrD-helicase domain-containing protein n=1 Tax='Camptotheca acuminata' phytoplasma TaxID=3239192 RepID=UPI003519DAB4